MDGMIWNNVRKEMDLSKTIRNKDIRKIKEYLGRKIHRWGQVYSPKELLRKEFGESYNPDLLVRYLEQKYLGS